MSKQKLVRPRLPSQSRSVPTLGLWTFFAKYPFHLNINISGSALCNFLAKLHATLLSQYACREVSSGVSSSKLAAQGFRSWGSPFWIMPPDLPFSSRILFCTRCIWEFQVCPAEAFNPNSSTFRRREFFGSESSDTQPWTLFFLRHSNWPSSTFHSRPCAEVTSRHQHVEIGNECHKCICFQTCNHDTRDDADNYVTIFFILPTIDKGLLALSRRTGL